MKISEGSRTSVMLIITSLGKSPQKKLN